MQEHIQHDSTEDYDSVFRRVLSDVINDGQKLTAGESLSVGNNQTTYEALNYSLSLANPRDRFLFHPLRRLKLTATIGRFAWMMSGSNLLSGIEFYEPRVRHFSDDGLTVPGSCDGARLLQPKPGLNQIQKIIELLKSEPFTRRATVTIYQPEDAGRVSRDIPCTIGIVFNIRAGGLHATTIMRSNNAVRVLPYDLFLFSLLSEVVASAVGVALASYHHFAVSMHIYESDLALAKEIAAAPPPLKRTIMKPMPLWTSMEESQKLVEFENELRANYMQLNEQSVREYSDRIAKGFADYWQGFAQILLFHALRMSPSLEPSEKEQLGTQLCQGLDEPLRFFLFSELEHQ